MTTPVALPSSVQIVDSEVAPPCFALDVAVLSQSFASLDVVAANSLHEVFLDPIPVTIHEFRHIFYSAGQTFGITKHVEEHCSYNHKISFLPKYRTQEGGTQPFNLLETIIANAEIDLNVARTCFTTTSLVDVERQLGHINTLYDIRRCFDEDSGGEDSDSSEESNSSDENDHHKSKKKHHKHQSHHHHHKRKHHEHVNVVCALTWNDIIQILKNQWQEAYLSPAAVSVNCTSSTPCIFYMLVVSVIFKSCNPCLLPTSVKFRYLLQVTDIHSLK